MSYKATPTYDRTQPCMMRYVNPTTGKITWRAKGIEFILNVMPDKSLTIEIFNSHTGKSRFSTERFEDEEAARIAIFSLLLKNGAEALQKDSVNKANSN